MSSESQQLDIGTPQGSVIGSFMFIVYMNFILQKIRSTGAGEVITYADDTSILYEANPLDLTGELDRISGKIDKVVGVFDKFGFKVNERKTDAILFRTSRPAIRDPPIRVGLSAIIPSETVKCLGFVIHERLSWRAHINSLASRC